MHLRLILSLTLVCGGLSAIVSADEPDAAEMMVHDQHKDVKVSTKRDLQLNPTFLELIKALYRLLCRICRCLARNNYLDDLVPERFRAIIGILRTLCETIHPFCQLTGGSTGGRSCVEIIPDPVVYLQHLCEVLSEILDFADIDALIDLLPEPYKTFIISIKDYILSYCDDFVLLLETP